MNDWQHIPDDCLLMIAKKSWNHLEPDEKLDIWNEVVKRWETLVVADRARRLAKKYLKRQFGAGFWEGDTLE